jgi:hypothetical protein
MRPCGAGVVEGRAGGSFEGQPSASGLICTPRVDQDQRVARFYRLVRLVFDLLVLRSRKDRSKDAEILVLRHQLAVLQRKVPRPRFEPVGAGNAFGSAVGALLRCVGVGRARSSCARRFGSDDSGEFSERRRDPPVGVGFDPEFIVPAAQVLHERVAVHDHAGAAITLEATHGSQPRLEPSVVRLNPIVRVLLGVVERAWEELIDDRAECPGPIGHDFRRRAVATEHGSEEPPRRLGIAPR